MSVSILCVCLSVWLSVSPVTSRRSSYRRTASKEASVQKARLLQAQDDRMRSLHTETLQQLHTWSSDPKNTQAYEQLLKDLIVQGIQRVTLREHGVKKISVRCRPRDAKMVGKLISSAVTAFHAEEEHDRTAKSAAATARGGRREALYALRVEAELDSARPLSDDLAGGVVVTALDGRIICDNTIEQRLALSESALTPVLRHVLFPSLRVSESSALSGGKPAARSENADVDLLA